MSRETKLVVDQLIEDFQKRPNDFVCDSITLTDKKTNIIYWVSVGQAGIWRPYSLPFGWFQTIRFHQGLKKWKAANMINKSLA